MIPCDDSAERNSFEKLFESLRVFTCLIGTGNDRRPVIGSDSSELSSSESQSSSLSLNPCFTGPGNTRRAILEHQSKSNRTISIVQYKGIFEKVYEGNEAVAQGTVDLEYASQLRCGGVPRISVTNIQKDG